MRPGLQVAADPTCLDVHDRARPERDGHGCPLGRDDRLVEADRCGDAAGQLCVAEQVFLVERLLDEEQAVFVEPCEMIEIVAPVRRVRVHLQHQLVAEMVPNRLHRLQVPAGLDLQLDAPVSGPEVALDHVQQLVDGARDAHGDPGRDGVGDAAEEGAERHAGGA